MTSPQPEFRHYLKEWRQRRCLSQAELARKIHIRTSQIGRWETNQHAIPMVAMFRLMRALDVTPQQFFLAPEEADAIGLADPESEFLPVSNERRGFP
jgi:transcriptional regulator with XRE-family HTH domain